MYVLQGIQSPNQDMKDQAPKPSPINEMVALKAMVKEIAKSNSKVFNLNALCTSYGIKRRGFYDFLSIGQVFKICQRHSNDNFEWFLNAATDALLAAENLALAAEAHGLGVCFLGTTLYTARDICRILHLPKGVIPLTTVVIGHPAEQPPLTDRLPLDAVVHYDRYKDYTDAEIDALMDVYKQSYDFATDDLETVRYQAREELAMKKMMDAEGCKAFSNTFQDLYGMKQLPGLASQHLMAQGYGYGGEGDWKVSAMTAIMKAMGENGNGASAFMEDYTYHLAKGQEYSLGAHMLEVCPSLAAGRPRIEVHPLGIGDREDPARLVFEGKEGDGIVVSLIDMGGRLRLICQDIHCVKPIMPMPNLPVARVMWQAEPSLTTGVECWITAGGAHHTVLSYDVTAEQMKDWATMMDIEFVHITKDTTVEGLEQQAEKMERETEELYEAAPKGNLTLFQ